MIIRSQDKKSITSDLNLTIKIESRIMSSCLKEEFPRQAMFRIFDSKDIPLGDYSTEEKAIKVFDMICEAYSRCKSTKELASGILFEAAKRFSKNEAEEFKKEHRENFIFQMPSDESVEV